jgi:hypothetical protein
MSKRTTRILDLLCDAGNWQNSINSVSEDIAAYSNDLRCCNDLAQRDVVEQYKAEAEDEVRRWSIKRDQIVVKLRALLDQLEAHEQDSPGLPRRS